MDYKYFKSNFIGLSPLSSTFALKLLNPKLINKCVMNCKIELCILCYYILCTIPI